MEEMWVPKSMLEEAENNNHKLRRELYITNGRLGRFLELLIPEDPDEDDMPKGGPIYGAPSDRDSRAEYALKQLVEAKNRLDQFLTDEFRASPPGKDTEKCGHIITICPLDDKPCPPSDKCDSCINWRVKEPQTCRQK